jgi:hypothetical protein
LHLPGQAPWPGFFLGSGAERVRADLLSSEGRRFLTLLLSLLTLDLNALQCPL